MKKLILMLIMCLFSFGAFAQTDSTKISTTERIIDKYGGKIVDSFNHMIDKITPVAEEGFKIAVRLQIAKGIGNLLIALIFPIMLIIFLKEYNKVDKILSSKDIPNHMNERYGVFGEDNINPKIIISLVLTIISAIGFPFFLYDGIVLLIVPEWFAIKEILQLFQ